MISEASTTGAERRTPGRRRRHVVARADEFPPGSRKIVRVGGREIGVFNSAGTLYALRNTCPHQGAPICQGRVTGTVMSKVPGQYEYVMEGQVLRCPWHGWEFDLATGKGLYDPYTHDRIATYKVTIENGEVVLFA